MYLTSQDYQTSNIVAQELTKKSQNTLSKTQQKGNPVLEELSPEVFEVPAKKCSLIWSTQQYGDANFREHLAKTTNRVF